mmetsp:Transcript_24500/g.68143  ORF Transcript_24500/g.68143 Transcript_24500/m.68143 type:complete len:312 (-) Transcript_24500:134-1069(-)
MGGKPGGSRCINTVQVLDAHGDPVLGEDGKPEMQRCWHVFMSTKQTRKTQRGTEVTAKSPVSTEAGDKPFKARQLKQGFYAVVAKAERMQTKIGGDLLVAMIAPTRSVDQVAEDHQSAKSQIITHTSKQRNKPHTMALVMRHSTGIAGSLIDKETEAKCLASAVELMATHGIGSRSGDDGNESLQGLQAIPERGGDRQEAAGQARSSLHSFLGGLGLERHLDRLMDNGLDLPALIRKCSDKSEDGLTPEKLAVSTSITIGAACKIFICATRAAELPDRNGLADHGEARPPRGNQTSPEPQMVATDTERGNS